VPYGPDDGTIAPWAVVAALPFAPDIVLPALRHWAANWPETTCGFDFGATCNPTFPDGSGAPCGWVSPHTYGLNMGPVILMIENYRSELLWRLMRPCPYLVAGLRRAGFSGGWL
jgi:hypothetical protein